MWWSFESSSPIEAIYTHGRVSGLTLFGLVAVTAMVTFYAFEKRHSLFILAFAGACGLASIYGFLIGAWPFGAVEAIWAVVALVRWRRRSRDDR